MAQHQPRKRFSQNFLKDDSVIFNIVSTIAPKPTDHLIEIGPGLGALTRPLLERAKALTAIELDRDLVEYLKVLQTAYPDFQILSDDALKVDFQALKKDARLLRIVGNLPYAISTPLIFHLLQYAHVIEDMFFMLQKEVVERMVAVPGSKDYGRLSVMLQVAAQANLCFLVPPESFYPVPKVDSAIVQIKPYRVSPYPGLDKARFTQIVMAAFSQRRKSIRNALKKWVTAEDFEKLGIDSGLRAEVLPVSAFVALASVNSP